jgi:UDP-glucose 4-epimerase
MKIFMTGGTGFIGSYVACALLKEGHELTILARNVNKVSGFIGNPLINLVHATLDDRGAIHEALKGQDVCIHVALGWGDTPIEMLEKDTAASVYIFQSAVEQGVKKIIYTSSIAAFGSAPVQTESAETMPTDLYGATKAATEDYLMAIARAYKVQANVVRPGYTFGNPAIEGGSIYTDMKFKNIIIAALKNEPIPMVKNNGTQFIWAGDLAQIYTSVLHSDLNRRMFTGVSTEFTTWAEIAEMIIAHIGSKSEIILEERGLPENGGTPIVVSPIEKEFGLSFVTRQKLQEHIEYLCTANMGRS